MKHIKNEPLRHQVNQNLPFVLNKRVSSSFSVFVTNWHIEPEFNLTIGGSETICVNNDAYVTKPGDIVAIDSGRVHVGTSNDWEHHCFIPSIEFLDSLGISFSGYTFTPFIQDERMTELFLDIVRESDKTGPFQYSKTIVAAQRFLLEYYSQYAKPIDQSKKTRTQKGDAHFIVTIQVLNYLHENFAKDFSIDAIAKEIGITTPYMCRCVKETTEMTIIEHLNIARCNAAYYYLSHSDKTINEIAKICGFNGSSYFAKIYQQVMGVSPSEVRSLRKK